MRHPAVERRARALRKQRARDGYEMRRRAREMREREAERVRGVIRAFVAALLTALAVALMLL